MLFRPSPISPEPYFARALFRPRQYARLRRFATHVLDDVLALRRIRRYPASFAAVWR
jgi:hypothetical protein